MSMESAVEAQWTVVIPFKGAPNGKSRLAGGSRFDSGAATHGFTASERALLAQAFLTDTLAAVRRTAGVERVLVVSANELAEVSERPAALAAAIRDGTALPAVTIVPDPGSGLNPAIDSGIAAARVLNATGWVAALTGDLPLLQAEDLAAALTLATANPLSVVTDKDGVGTTMLTAAPGVPVLARFAGASLVAHERAGHVGLDLAAESTLRFDIDSVDDLDVALMRSPGLGRATRELVARLRPRVEWAARNVPGGDSLG
jgi:2-phospho-L-lactate/phosphoenolpyruvate guanylyltransferase